MKYSDYRSQCLRSMWPYFTKLLKRPTHVILKQAKYLSLWSLDDICAEAWRVEEPIENTIRQLKDYILSILFCCPRSKCRYYPFPKGPKNIVQTKCCGCTKNILSTSKGTFHHFEQKQ